MSTSFRIIAGANDAADPVAIINARQLAAFRAFLRAEGTRLGLSLLDPDDHADTRLPVEFEARVCPLAVAAIARVFDYDEAVIAVLDEAQYRGRRVLVRAHPADRSIQMRPSPASDRGGALDLAAAAAHALP